MKRQFRSKWQKRAPRQRRFILRALKWTDAGQKEIARRAWIRAGAAKAPKIAALNRILQIRTPAQSQRIAQAAAKRTRARKKEAKKINHFSPDEKLERIESNRKAIRKVARCFWGYYSSIRHKYLESFRNLMAVIENHVFEQLDYYDPKARTREGKRRSVTSWIMDGTEIFCRGELTSEQRLMERQMAEESDSRPGRKERRATRALAESADARANRFEIAAIPITTRFFLGKLGIDLNLVAGTDWPGVQDFLIRVAKDRNTGLTKLQQRVTVRRLQGWTQVKLAKTSWKKRKTTKQAIMQIEDRAVLHMQKAIERVDFSTRLEQGA